MGLKKFEINLISLTMWSSEQTIGKSHEKLWKQNMNKKSRNQSVLIQKLDQPPEFPNQEAADHGPSM
jgi:hypothetical protein